MIVTVNGEAVELGPTATLATLAALLDVPERGTAVAIDGEVVPRTQWPRHGLAAGQHIEILTAMQGG